MRNPREAIVTAAVQFLGTEETTRNRFHRDREVWASTNYPDGYENREPYCAAFVCHCVKLANESLELRNLPKSPSVAGWKTWARDPKNGVKILKAHDGILPGDIVSFLPHFSHIGIVEHMGGATCYTIEANTSDEGVDGSQRDGDGIYRRRRPISICGEFYRLPARAEKA